MCVAFYTYKPQFPIRREVKMESLTEEEISIIQAHKEATGNVTDWVVTFFHNDKVRCPIL